MPDISCVVVPIRNHAFFEQTVLEGQVGHAFLQITRLRPQVLYFIAGCSAGRVTGQPTFAGFHELLRPGVIQALRYALPAAQLSNASSLASCRGHEAREGASPRRPSITIRILSSAEKCRRVARRMALTTRSAGFFALECF